jgi:UDP:flavonoid glycosyltransferase YjiC (YdhE family)
MVPLAKAFLDRGDEVLWVAAPEVCPTLAADGFIVRAAGLNQAESRQLFDRQFPEFEALAPAERPAFMFPRLFGTVRAGPMLADLIPIMAEWRPDVNVHEAGELAGPIAAATLAVPSITHAFGGVTPKERVAAASIEVSSLWRSQGLDPPPYAGCYDFLYLDIYPASLQTTASHIPVVQPLRPVAFATDAGDDHPPDWLLADDGDPLVYFTLGTVFNTDTSLLATIVNGLALLPVRVLVTVGPAGDPDVLGPQPEHVHVARYVPHTQILPHAAIVVSHAGSGTFLAALGHGIPQLCVPQAADQFVNAAACVRSGAGLAIQPGEVTEDNVRAATERLIGETAFGRAAQHVRSEIQDMPGPDVVANIIEERVRDR